MLAGMGLAGSRLRRVRAWRRSVVGPAAAARADRPAGGGARGACCVAALGAGAAPARRLPGRSPRAARAVLVAERAGRDRSLARWGSRRRPAPAGGMPAVGVWLRRNSPRGCNTPPPRSPSRCSGCSTTCCAPTPTSWSPISPSRGTCVEKVTYRARISDADRGRALRAGDPGGHVAAPAGAARPHRQRAPLPGLRRARRAGRLGGGPMSDADVSGRGPRSSVGRVAGRRAGRDRDDAAGPGAAGGPCRRRDRPAVARPAQTAPQTADHPAGHHHGVRRGAGHPRRHDAAHRRDRCPLVATGSPLDSRRPTCSPSSGLLFLGTRRAALAGIDTGTSFGGMGASREITIAALVEPTILLAVFALSIPAGLVQSRRHRRHHHRRTPARWCRWPRLLGVRGAGDRDHRRNAVGCRSTTPPPTWS